MASATLKPTSLVRRLAGPVVLFALVLIAYAPAWHGQWLWDDDGHLTPPALRSLAGLVRIWTDLGATQQYYPVLHSAFWVEHQLWGDAVAGYHAVNFALHALAAMLVVAVARRLDLPGAFAAGALFALHPVGVESVAWISEQKNTLSLVFYLSAAYVYLGYDRDRRLSTYRLASLCFLLALLTKTVTATLPVALLAVIWWRRGELKWSRDMRPLALWIGLGAAFGLFTAWYERWGIGAEGAVHDLLWLQRALLAGRTLWFYLGKLIWPVDLAFIYPRWTIDPAQLTHYLPSLAALGAAAMAWLGRKRFHGTFTAGLVYVIGLFPVLGFLNVYPFLFSYVADHFQYLASVALCIAAAAGGASVVQRLVPTRATVVGCAVLAVTAAALGSATWRQAHLYRDPETLYRATLRLNPECWLAHNNLARILAQDAVTRAEAIGHFETALRLNPAQADAHFNLANALAKTPARREDAIAHYRASLALNPDQADAFNNLGIALARTPAGRRDAVTAFRRAVELAPSFAAAHANLGTAWLRLPGHVDDAIRAYETALRLQPGSATAHFDLGNALARDADRIEAAITEYQRALALDPTHEGARTNLTELRRKLAAREPGASTLALP